MQPELHSEIITSEVELIKPDCRQRNTSRSVSEHNSISCEDLAVVSCRNVDQYADPHSREVIRPQQVATMPVNNNRQCASDLQVLE